MATLFISEHTELPVFQGGGGQALAQPTVARQTVSIGGTSAQSSAFNAKTKFIRLHCDVICSFVIDADPTAAATDSRMAASQTEIHRVRPGHKVAVITNS